MRNFSGDNLNGEALNAVKCTHHFRRPSDFYNNSMTELLNLNYSLFPLISYLLTTLTALCRFPSSTVNRYAPAGKELISIFAL